VEKTIRETIKPGEITSIVDNLGLPYSGINLAYSTSAPVGPGDADIFINLAKKHSSCSTISASCAKLAAPTPRPSSNFCRRTSSARSLNFGLPSPLDVQVTGPNTDANREFIEKLLPKFIGIAGAVDLHIQQPYDYPQINVDVDRSKAQFLGLTQQNVASNMLISLSGSFQTTPSFWIDPKSGTQYNVVAQTPQYRLSSLNDLATRRFPTVGSVPAASGTSQILANVSTMHRSVAPAVVSHYNAQVAFDIYGNVQDADLGSVATQFNRSSRMRRRIFPRARRSTSRARWRRCSNPSTACCSAWWAPSSWCTC
jgi:multidrug efflux pump subunit AcrB